MSNKRKMRIKRKTEISLDSKRKTTESIDNRKIKLKAQISQGNDTVKRKTQKILNRKSPSNINFQ